MSCARELVMGKGHLACSLVGGLTSRMSNDHRVSAIGEYQTPVQLITLL